MKASKYNRLRSTVKYLRSELREERRTYREVVDYQNREIAGLRKQLANLNAAKESELDEVINHLRAVAKELRATSERELVNAYVYGTTRI